MHGVVLVAVACVLAGVVVQGQPPAGENAADLHVGYSEMMSTSQISNLACHSDVSDYFTVHVAGVSLQAYPNACGRCISLQCANPADCQASTKSTVIVAVVDDCIGCGSNTMRVGSFVVRELSGDSLPPNGSLPVYWSYADCTPLGTVNVSSRGAPQPPKQSLPVILPILLPRSISNKPPVVEQKAVPGPSLAAAPPASGQSPPATPLPTAYALSVPTVENPSKVFSSVTPSSELSMSFLGAVDSLSPAPKQEPAPESQQRYQPIIGEAVTTLPPTPEHENGPSPVRMATPIAEESRPLPAESVVPSQERALVLANDVPPAQEPFVGIHTTFPVFPHGLLPAHEALLPPAPEAEVTPSLRTIVLPPTSTTSPPKAEAVGLNQQREPAATKLPLLLEGRGSENIPVPELALVMPVAARTPPSLEISRVMSPATGGTSPPFDGGSSKAATPTSLAPPGIESRPALHTFNSSIPARTGLLTPGYYDPFPKGAFSNLACAFGSVSPYFQTHFASINTALWPQNGGPACGSCVSVRCADPSACPNGTQTIAQVLDTCGSCAEGDIILNPAALREVVGQAERVPVVWEQTACRDHIQGNMYLWAGPGGNSYWRQLTLSNAAQGVASVSINNEALQRGENDRWLWANNGKLLNESNPFLLRVTGIDGTTVHAKLTAVVSQALDIQI